MLAAVGQIRLMHAYQDMFGENGVVVAQALLTHADVEGRRGYLNVRNTLEMLLANGVVPIVNENDVVETEELSETRFGDNDTLSALVANIVDADLLLLLSDVGGLYTADPNRDAGAELIARVERVEDVVYAYGLDPPMAQGVCALLADGGEATRAHYRPGNLEDVFLTLTGRALVE